MHEATTIPALTSDTSENLTAAARKAESWFGEPFLQPDEDPLQALAPETARRAALEDALAEMDAGLAAPSARWKVRYGLMLGLERVITDHPPRLASGTELRRHQIDALAGMLTELISNIEHPAENGGPENGAVDEEAPGGEEEEPLIEADQVDDEDLAREAGDRGVVAVG